VSSNAISERPFKVTSLCVDIINYISEGREDTASDVVFLAAKMNGDFNDPLTWLPLLWSFLHTATLVHDDVVDDRMKEGEFFDQRPVEE
jgi:geranylgeranyl pyrophosphate synthase